MAQGM